MAWLFWDVTQRLLVVTYQRFGIAYHSYFRCQAVQAECRDCLLKYGIDLQRWYYRHPDKQAGHIHARAVRPQRSIQNEGMGLFHDRKQVSELK